MIKFETHCHTGASACADCPIEIIAKNLKSAGYGGAAITNHLQKKYFDGYLGETDKEKISYFLSVYEKTRRVFAENGLKTFLAAEVLADEAVHSEYIIYGFDEKFLYDNKPLFYYNQKELFKLCDKNGVFMYKCHPFRTGEYAGNPAYLHGAESFNGHFHHDNNNVLAEKFCEENNLIKMSGTDYHHDGQPITAGIYLPEEINDEISLKEFIFKNNFKRIENKELYEREYKICHGIK